MTMDRFAACTDLAFRLSAIGALLCTLAGCSTLPEGSLTYLALGDSYTIGEAVPTAKRWPVQLANRLNERGLPIADPVIIARTGWRSDELYSAVSSDRRVGSGKFDMVSLLIGVNDQYQGKDINRFPENFEKLMAIAIEAGKRGNESVFVLSIPDYGATPFGKSDAKRIGQEIDAYNAICEDICKKLNVPFYTITDISRRASTEPSLVAPDDLHPSGDMYGLWVEHIVEEVRNAL